jgi:hypothetical protein
MLASGPGTTLDGEAFAALCTAALQDGAAAPRAHALAEAVHLFSPLVVRLERALHWDVTSKKRKGTI